MYKLFTAERVASVYIRTRKHGIIRFLYKIYVLIQVNMSVYWPYPKQASDCVQRDPRYLVYPRARSSALMHSGHYSHAPRFTKYHRSFDAVTNLYLVLELILVQ